MNFILRLIVWMLAWVLVSNAVAAGVEDKVSAMQAFAFIMLIIETLLKAAFDE